MKPICATASGILLACAFYADAHGNTGGAWSALILSSLWFIGYCYAP